MSPNSMKLQFIDLLVTAEELIIKLLKIIIIRQNT